MRVAMLVGVLMVNAIAALYESGWALDASTDAGLSAGEVQAYDGDLPPPPSLAVGLQPVRGRETLASRAL